MIIFRWPASIKPCCGVTGESGSVGAMLEHDFLPAVLSEFSRIFEESCISCNTLSDEMLAKLVTALELDPPVESAGVDT